MVESTTSVTSERDGLAEALAAIDEARALLLDMRAQLASLVAKVERWEPVVDELLTRTEGPRFWKKAKDARRQP